MHLPLSEGHFKKSTIGELMGDTYDPQGHPADLTKIEMVHTKPI
jgi:hypothetical protein